MHTSSMTIFQINPGQPAALWS